MGQLTHSESGGGEIEAIGIAVMGLPTGVLPAEKQPRRSGITTA